MHQVCQFLRLGLVLPGKAKTGVFQPILCDGVRLSVLRASERIHQALYPQIIGDCRHVGTGKLVEIVQRDGFQEGWLNVDQLTAQFLDDARLRYALGSTWLLLWSALFSLIIWRACFR